MDRDTAWAWRAIAGESAAACAGTVVGEKGAGVEAAFGGAFRLAESWHALRVIYSSYAVILAEGEYPESHALRVNSSPLQMPRFWIPGCAENDASLRSFRKMGNGLPMRFLPRDSFHFARSNERL